VVLDLVLRKLEDNLLQGYLEDLVVMVLASIDRIEDTLGLPLSDVVLLQFLDSFFRLFKERLLSKMIVPDRVHTDACIALYVENLLN
jgi:hypothetical protein